MMDRQWLNQVGASPFRQKMASGLALDFISIFGALALATRGAGLGAKANTLTAGVGGAIIAGFALLLGLKMDAPVSVQGAVVFTFAVTVASFFAVWVLIYVARLIGAPARIYEHSRRSLDDASVRIRDLEEAAKPTFSLSFHPEAEGLSMTSVTLATASGAPSGFAREVMANYLRIRAEAVSDKSVTGCRAFLTKLGKESPLGDQVTDIPLPHSVALRNAEAFDIHPHVVHAVDFLMSAETNNRIGPPDCMWPNSLRGVLDETGTYHFTITVNGQGISKSITVALGQDVGIR
jgi:hypothetical protein